MTQSSTTPTRLARDAHLKWVPITDMRVSALAQRDLNTNRVNQMAADFDPEMIGNPVVNLRDGHYFIIDGQHRVEVLKAVGWGDQTVQCWAYTGLTEEEEADRFLKLSDTLTIDAFAKFRVGIKAGRETECEINRVVLANGLCVSRDALPGAIAAVGTLRRVYARSDSKTLGRTLRIARDSFGDAGLDAAVLDGLGHLCARYNGELDEPAAIVKLAAVNGGANGLLGRAEQLRRSTASSKAVCVAAAAVEFINRGKGGKKLSDWWKS